MSEVDAGTPAVRARQVTVRYGPVVAVDAADLTVGRGEIVGIVGPNGAGKTSLIECIEGVRRPASGQISVAGLDPQTDRDRLTRVIGVQPQHSSYPSRVRVGELCRLFAGFYPRPADPAALLERFDLADRIGHDVTKLSGGEQQRLALALALIGQPEIVFLDELTSGLDPAARRSVWEDLRRRNDDGLTILLTSHHMDEVEYLCDRVVVLVAGRIVDEDTVEGLIRRHAGTGTRLIAEDAGGDGALRADLERLGAGVRVTPAGRRLHIDVAEPPALTGVEQLLANRHVAARHLNASLEDVYLTLTGHPGGSDGH